MDTDLRERLLAAGVLNESQTPRMVHAIEQKLQSPCLDFQLDFPLHCFWHDFLLAKKLSGIVSMADRRHVSPEELASDMQQFSAFWQRQQFKLEDVVRRREAFPNVFLTIAIAEWAFPLHPHLFNGISLTDTQLLFTRHAYHCLCQVLEKLLTNQFAPQTTGVTVFHEYTLRFEFQRRGTLHVHVLAWASLQLAASILTGQTGKPHQSPLVTLLEKIFRGSIDVQVLASLHAGCLCLTASKASL